MKLHVPVSVKGQAQIELGTVYTGYHEFENAKRMTDAENAIAENKSNIELLNEKISNQAETTTPEPSNLFNKDTVTENTRIYSVDGREIATTAFVSTARIALEANTTYHCYGMYANAGFMVFYNESGTIDNTLASFVVGENINHMTLTVGDAPCVARFSIEKSIVDTAYISKYVDMYRPYGEVDYSFASPYHAERIEQTDETLTARTTMADKKVLVMGDSISATYYLGYKKWIDLLIDDGFFTAENVTNDSIHATGFVATLSDTSNDDFITRINAVENPGEYDLVILFGGINDFIKGIDLDAFKAAVDEYFSYLCTNFINARIVVISPLRAFANWQNSNQNEYTDYIKSVANSYSLPILNATEESGFMPHLDVFRNTWTIHLNNDESNPEHDGLHPIEEYNRKFFMPYIRGFLKQFI